MIILLPTSISWVSGLTRKVNILFQPILYSNLSLGLGGTGLTLKEVGFQLWWSACFVCDELSARIFHVQWITDQIIALRVPACLLKKNKKNGPCEKAKQFESSTPESTKHSWVCCAEFQGLRAHKQHLEQLKNVVNAVLSSHTSGSHGNPGEL